MLQSRATVWHTLWPQIRYDTTYAIDLFIMPQSQIDVIIRIFARTALLSLSVMMHKFKTPPDKLFTVAAVSCLGFRLNKQFRKLRTGELYLIIQHSSMPNILRTQCYWLFPYLEQTPIFRYLLLLCLTIRWLT